jgi:hypothetical protein
LKSPIAPKVWISGHTHRNYIGRVGKARLVSNQGGYAFKTEEDGFDLEGLVL